MPRITGKQRHRNHRQKQSSSRKPFRILEEGLVIPYLDSIITSLEVRFPEENTHYLNPAQMQKMTTENLKV